MRQAAIHRKTGETDISVNLSIDGSGRFEGTRASDSSTI